MKNFLHASRGAHKAPRPGMGCVVSSGSGAASGGSRRGKVFPQAVPTEDDADFVQGEYERAQAKVALLADLLTSKASQVPITDRYNLQRGNIGERLHNFSPRTSRAVSPVHK